MKIELSLIFSWLVTLIATAGTLLRIRKDMKDERKQQEKERQEQAEKRIENEKAQESRHLELKHSLDSVVTSVETVKTSMETLSGEVKETNSKVLQNSSAIDRIDGEVKSLYKHLDWMMELITPILHHLEIPASSLRKIEREETKR